MTIKSGTVNPLNVLGFRKINNIPDHFERMTVPEQVDIQKIDQWIYKNLNSRYCIRKIVSLDSANKLFNKYEIGIEDQGELSLMILSCPYLHNRR